MLLGSIPASSTGTIETTYLPQFLKFTATTVPTALKVTVLGDGTIYDIDGPGVDNVNGWRMVGDLAANEYRIQLANSQVLGKNVTITITNAVAAPLDIYGYGVKRLDRETSFYMQTVRATVLANSGQDFDDFAWLGMPAIGSSDELNITYQDGFVQKMTDVELESLIQQTQGKAQRAVDNFAQNVRKVSYIPTAQRTVYLTKYVPTFGSVNVQANQ